MEDKHIIFSEITEYLNGNLFKTNCNLENLFNTLFDGNSQYSIYSKVYYKNTIPIDIYLTDLGNRSHDSNEQFNIEGTISENGLFPKGTWYENENGYGAIVTLSSLDDKDLFEQIKRKMASPVGVPSLMARPVGVGVNLWYCGQYNILWFEDLKIYRYEPFREPGSFHQRNVDGALFSYFSENIPSFRYFPHHSQNLHLTLNVRNGRVLSSGYCLLFLDKKIKNKSRSYTEIVNILNNLTTEEILNELKNLWYLLMTN